MATIGERSVSFEDSEDEDSRATDEDLGYGDDREESTPPTEAKAEPRQEEVLSAGSRGVSRPLSRNLADDLSAVAGTDAADDDWCEEQKEDEPSSKAVRDSDGLAVRPPVNGDTPAANKVLARCFEKMQSSDWIRQFNPRQTRQATWGDLRDDLAYPVNSLSTTQVAEDTVSLLRTMGMDVRNYPSTLTLKDQSGNGSAAGTPAKVDEGSRDFSDNVFSKGDESPYFQDSHMVTPRSASRARRLADDCDGSSSDSSQRQLAVANESERRSAAEGTYTRADRRFRRNNQVGRGDSRERPDTEHRERAVGGTTQPTTATGDASCASRFMMRGSANCTDTSKASSSMLEQRKTSPTFRLSCGLSSMKAI
ncbi:hypothetical protein PC117_g26712 [Phytophthora cactorum]|uniref:Eukaryotic/viral aspartic protease n=1 Tax=Phytophthora cactorum TaxID=29920 RepID=A0A8T1ADD3_9STRA|nr:hypothetical protein PC117_g26712 [Phytophthora cactorum]